MNGIRCKNGNGDVCSADAVGTLEYADLGPLRNGTGLENIIALSAMVGMFHDALRGVFKTQDWGATYR
jgi:hypothetical protein